MQLLPELSFESDPHDDFEHYRVGGYVRDLLLGIPSHDVDFMVVGQSPESMLKMGFTQVGNSFPVFLHPINRCEYALARAEQTNGPGHGDFIYRWKNVSIAEDLARRDLTINAMALHASGRLYDLHGGRQDLADKVLRHVSGDFADDPLRVLRVARFAASLGFEVAPETLLLMRRMTALGMLKSLAPERVWAETQKALVAKDPVRYFETLEACGALAELFPELAELQYIPQRRDYHAEGDVWTHTKMVLAQATLLTTDLPDHRKLRIRFAGLTHDLGKAATPRHLLWGEDGTVIGKHHGHEAPERFGRAMEGMADRLRLPGGVLDFAWAVAEQHQLLHGINKLRPIKLVELYENLGLKRRLVYDPDILDDIGYACMADARGRYYLVEGDRLFQPVEYPQAAFFKVAMLCVQNVPDAQMMREGIEGGASIDTCNERVRNARCRAVQDLKAQHSSHEAESVEP